MINVMNVKSLTDEDLKNLYLEIGKEVRRRLLGKESNLVNLLCPQNNKNFGNIRIAKVLERRHKLMRKVRSLSGSSVYMTINEFFENHTINDVAETTEEKVFFEHLYELRNKDQNSPAGEILRYCSRIDFDGLDDIKISEIDFDDLLRVIPKTKKAVLHEVTVIRDFLYN